MPCPYPFRTSRPVCAPAKGAPPQRPYRSLHHSPFAIRHSRYFCIRHSPFAIRGFSPILARPRKWVSNNALRKWVSNNACVGVQERRPGFGIVSESLAMSRQGGLRTRPYPDPTIRHSPFAIRCLSPFAIRGFSPILARPRKWVSNNALRKWVSNNACVGVQERRPGFGIVSDSLAMSRQGGLRTRPYPDPTIRHSLFAIRGFSPILARPRKRVSNNACVGVQERRPGFGIVSDSLAMSRQGGLRTRPYPDPTIRHSLFAVFLHSPLATRDSPSFTIRYSLFAIRCL
jgi:hypothetical protein